VLVRFFTFISSNQQQLTHVTSHKTHNDTTNRKSGLEADVERTDEAQTKEQGPLFALYVCCLNEQTLKKFDGLTSVPHVF